MSRPFYVDFPKGLPHRAPRRMTQSLSFWSHGGERKAVEMHLHFIAIASHGTSSAGRRGDTRGVQTRPLSPLGATRPFPAARALWVFEAAGPPDSSRGSWGSHRAPEPRPCLLSLLHFAVRPHGSGRIVSHDAGRVEMDVTGEVDRKVPSLCKKPALCLLRAPGVAALWPPRVSADLPPVCKSPGQHQLARGMTTACHCRGRNNHHLRSLVIPTHISMF